MKTPKFRAYDHATKRMVYSTDENIAFLFDKEGWVVVEKVIPDDLISKISGTYHKYKVTQQGEGDLMKAVGKFDIDIYENDIIELTGLFLPDNNKKTLTYTIYNGKVFDYAKSLFLIIYSVKIIANIYQK